MSDKRKYQSKLENYRNILDDENLATFYREDLGKLSLRELRQEVHFLLDKNNILRDVSNEISSKGMIIYIEKMDDLCSLIGEICNLEENLFIQRRENTKEEFLKKKDQIDETVEELSKVFYQIGFEKKIQALIKNKINPIDRKLKELIELSVNIKPLNIDPDELNDLRKTNDKLEFHLDEFRDESNKLIRKLEKDTEDIRLNLDEINNSLDKTKYIPEINEKIDAFKKNQNRLEANQKTLEKRLSNTISQTEILNQSDVFFKESKKNITAGNLWLGGSALAFLLLIFIIHKVYCNSSFLCDIFYPLESPEYLGEEGQKNILAFIIFKNIFFRLAVVGLFLFIFLFSIKNYNAAMHNKTVNINKGNAYAAAVHILRSISTTDGINHFVDKVIPAIFQFHKSGYLKKEVSNHNNLLQRLFDKIV